MSLYTHVYAREIAQVEMNMSTPAGLSTGPAAQYNLMPFERRKEGKTEKPRVNREREKRDPSAFTGCDEDKQAENKESDRRTDRISE